jgi:hypothetical protein
MALDEFLHHLQTAKLSNDEPQDLFTGLGITTGNVTRMMKPL